MDMISGLLGIEVLARNREGMEGEVDFELQVELDALKSGTGVLRVERVKLAQLLPWGHRRQCTVIGGPVARECRCAGRGPTGLGDPGTAIGGGVA